MLSSAQLTFDMCAAACGVDHKVNSGNYPG